MNSFGSAAAAAAAAAATVRPAGCSFTAKATTVIGGVHHVAQQHYAARDSAVQLSAAKPPHEYMLSKDSNPPVDEKDNRKQKRVRYGISLDLTAGGMTRGGRGGDPVLYCTVLYCTFTRFPAPPHRYEQVSGGTSMRWTMCALDVFEDSNYRPYLENRQTFWRMIPIFDCAARYRDLKEPMRSVYSKCKGVRESVYAFPAGSLSQTRDITVAVVVVPVPVHLQLVEKPVLKSLSTSLLVSR